nr:unnamed protein product [Callosobruchus chinensis]
MSRNRFRHIMQNIHCCDNQNLNQEDRFSKIRPLIDILNNKFLDLAPLEEHHCVDESMIPYYGRHPNNLNYHIFFDNLFTSLPLLLELKSRGLKGTGTIRENRLPKSCPIKSADKLRKEQRGSLDFASSVNNELTVCKWHDNNIVSIFSNNMKVLPTTQIKRFSRKEKKVIYVPQPNIIKKYNENMGGVDRADENISLYRVSIRGKKWYFPLLCHFVDMAEQNAWRIHKVNGGKLDHLGFRRIIATGILESFKKRQLLQGCSKLSKHAHSYSRYDGMDHIMVVYQDKQTRCASCHKKCNFLCQKCDIALHPKQCFLLYHTK